MRERLILREAVDLFARDRAKRLHEAIAAMVTDCICLWKPRLLCTVAYNGLSCTRDRAHMPDGIHVACAGSAGPHAVASWAEMHAKLPAIEQEIRNNGAQEQNIRA